MYRGAFAEHTPIVASSPVPSVRPGTERDAVIAAVARWVDAGIISREQADAALAAEAPDGPRSPRAGLVTEALAYLGGALVLGAAVLLVEMVWSELAVWQRVAVPTVSAALVLAAGEWLRRAPARADTSPGRLQSGLWLLGTALVATAGVVLGDQVLGLDPTPTWVLAGAAASVVAAPLYRARPTPAQHVALYLALVTGATALAAAVGTGAVLAGLGCWGLSSLWVALTWAGVLRHPTLGRLLGGIGALVGAALMWEQGWGHVLLLATVTALFVLGVRLRSIGTLVLASAGALVGVPAAAAFFVEDAVAVPLALLATGGLLLAAGVAVTRSRTSRPA